MLKIKTSPFLIIMPLFAVFIISFYLVGCNSSTPSDIEYSQDSRTWKFFKIELSKDEDIEIEKYFVLDTIRNLDEYWITVNLIDNKVKVCTYTEPLLYNNLPPKFTSDWHNLSKNMREKLVNWQPKKWIEIRPKESNNPTKWTHFKIDVRTVDDSIFSIIAQDYIGIELENYTLVVNISNPNPENQYIVFGDELDPCAIRQAWSDFSPIIQNGLINWDKGNKKSLNIIKNWF